MYTPISIDVFIAAYSGCLSGMFLGHGIPQSTDPTHYTHLTEIALAYAESFDTEYAAVLPNALQLEEIEMVCSTTLDGKQPGDPDALLAGFWTITVRGVIALLTEADSIVAANVATPIPIPAPPAGIPVIQIATVVGVASSLKSTVPATGIIAIANGYYAAGDGGSAPAYFWDTASALAGNDGTVINPTGHVGNGRWLALYTGAVDGRWFGAQPTQTALVNTATFTAAAVWQDSVGGGVVGVSGMFPVIMQNVGGTALPMQLVGLTGVSFEGHNKYADGFFDPGVQSAGAQPGIAGIGNGLVTFQDCNRCGCRTMTLQGANVWTQPRVDTGLTVETKKGVYFQFAATGNPDCFVEDCYIADIEGEAVFSDGAGNDNQRFNRNHFFHCLTNVINPAGTNVECNDNYIDTCGQSALLVNGTDIQFERNIVVVRGGYTTYGDVIVLDGITTGRVIDNLFVGYKFGANRTMIGAGGFLHACKDIVIQGNTFRACELVYSPADPSAFISLTGATGLSGIVVRNNHFQDCNANIQPGNPDLPYIRLYGGGGTGFECVVEGNSVSGTAATPPTTIVNIEATVDVANKIVIGVNYGVTAVTKPFVFYVLPMLDCGQAAIMATGANLTDSSPTINIGQGSRRILPPNTLTVNRTVILGTTGGPVLNEIQRIERYDTTAHTLAIVNGGPAAGTLYTFPISVARAADFQWNGTDWVMAGTAAITPVN